MSMMKYIHAQNLCCAPDGGDPLRYPRKHFKSLQSSTDVPGMPHHLHCEIKTQHFHGWGWADSSVFLSSSFSTTFSFSLSLLDTRFKCYFLSLCCAHRLTLSQVIGNLHVWTCACRVENLTCTKKKVHAFVQECMPKIEHCSPPWRFWMLRTSPLHLELTLLHLVQCFTPPPPLHFWVLCTNASQFGQCTAMMESVTSITYCRSQGSE